MKSLLWLKLMGIFALIIIIGSIVNVVVINFATQRQYFQFINQRDKKVALGLVSPLEDYYKTYRNWEGLDVYLKALLYPQNPPPTRHRHMPMRQHFLFIPHIIVVDTRQRVIADSLDKYPLFSTLSFKRGKGISLSYEEKHIGSVYTGSMLEQSLAPPEKEFLGTVTKAVLLSAVIVAVVALMLGSFLFFHMIQPLRKLEQASNKIAGGDFSIRVNLKQKDEIGKLAASFNSMAHSLRQSDAWKRQIIADAAHELRTPVSLLQSHLEMILDGVYELKKEHIESLYTESKRLSQLINNLEELAFAESGRLFLNFEKCNLKEIATQAKKIFFLQIEQKGIRITLKIAKKLPQIQADKQRIIQVFSNLFSNALRHTPQNGTINISITLKAQNMVLVKMEDSGPGIPEGDLKHIFERFYRIDKDRNRTKGGSGLGLAISREIVRQHGGDMWADNTGKKGACIYFTLPVNKK